MFRAMRLFVWTSLLVLAIALPPASAQTGLATVTGLVTDNSGAAVPGVTVTATNQATNVDYTAVSNEAGAYLITAVPIGEYVVRSVITGFKSVQSNVSLSASQTARVDFKLEVGAVEEKLEVVATGAVLQTENAVVGQTMQREQVEKLPIQGRNLATATLYAAGVTTPNPASFNDLKNTGGGRPYVNGQREQGNNFMLDGVDMNDAIDNLIAYQPSPDAVEQVSVETNNYSPELGNVAGAIVNMVIKSGTNAFHGNGFYYWRDNDLAATPWATNRAGGRKAEFNRKIFGATVGGPIAQNKVFFFRLPGRTPAVAAGRRVRHRDSRRVAARRSQQPPQPAHADRRERSADRAAVPEQPDPHQPLQPVRAQPAGRRGALSARQRHPVLE